MTTAVSTECGEPVTLDRSGGSTTPTERIHRHAIRGWPTLQEHRSFDDFTEFTECMRDMLLRKLDRAQPLYCGEVEDAYLPVTRRNDLLRGLIAYDPARQGFAAQAAALDEFRTGWATATFRSASVLCSAYVLDSQPRLAELSCAVWDRAVDEADVNRENEFRTKMLRMTAQASAEGAEAATSEAQALALRVWRSLLDFGLVETDVDYECRGGIVLEVTLYHPALRTRDGRRATITAENDGRVSVLTSDGSSPSINVLSTTTRRPAGVNSYTIKELVEHARRFLEG